MQATVRSLGALQVGPSLKSAALPVHGGESGLGAHHVRKSPVAGPISGHGGLVTWHLRFKLIFRFCAVVIFIRQKPTIT